MEAEHDDARAKSLMGLQPSYARLVVGGVERLVIAPTDSAGSMLRELLPLLHRSDRQARRADYAAERGAGSYQSGPRRSRCEEVVALLDRFENTLQRWAA